jgi:hypothetical protein
MADKDDDSIEEIETGEEGNLVDDNNSENDVLSQARKSYKGEEEEDTVDLDEEQEDGEEENNDILYTNVDGDTANVSKEGFFKKLKRKLGLRPKVHTAADDKSASNKSSTTVTMGYVPPPAPLNMPSARDAGRARRYRKEKIRYGKEKMIYYLDGMRDQTILISDLIMRSEQNTEYVKGV